jgi:hypothetical protein
MSVFSILEKVRAADSLKTVTKKTVIESFKSPSLAGFFVTVCDRVYFYTSLHVAYA